MSHTHLSHSTSRRDLAGSLRGSRSRKHARLRHRHLQAERLEDRPLLATISGQAFNDLDSDGFKEGGGESGQSGWTVYLDADGNGQLDTGETSTTTTGDGSYSFDGLAAGTYTVAEVQQPGWRQMSPVGSVPGIERVSVANDGTQGNGSAGTPSISGDGRYMAFYFGASNFVPGDTNGVGASHPKWICYNAAAWTLDRTMYVPSPNTINLLGSRQKRNGNFLIRRSQVRILLGVLTYCNFGGPALRWSHPATSDLTVQQDRRYLGPEEASQTRR